MKTIAQVLLSLALSLAVTAGFNANARGRIQHLLDKVETTTTRVTDFAARTVSSAAANANGRVSVNANTDVFAGSKNSASASANANGGASLSTMLKDAFGRGQVNAAANTQGSATTTDDGSLLNLIFGGQGSANGGFGIGK